MASGKFWIGWRQIAASFLTLTLTALITSSYSSLAVELGREFKPSRMVLMLAMTVVSGVAALISPPLGRVLDRMNMRLVMALGTLSLATAYLAISLATDFRIVLAIYGLFAAPANILLGPLAGTVLLSRWFAKRRGTAIGIAIAGIAAGNFFYPPILQWLLDTFEWRLGLRFLALIVLAVGLGAAAMTVNRPSDRGLFPDGAPEEPDRDEARVKAETVPTSAILKDYNFWLIAIVVATVTAGLKGMITNLVSMTTDVGIDASAAALLLSGYAVAGFTAKLGFAAIADHVPPRLLMVISLAGYGVASLVMAAAGASYWTLALGVGMLGLFGGVMMPMESFLIPRLYGREVVGRVGGLLNFVLLGFLLTSPPLFGLIFDLTGSYKAIFLIFAGLSALSLVLVRFLRTEPRPLVAG